MKLFIGWRLFLFSIILIVPFFGWAITRIVKDQRFDDNCTYHIQQGLSSNDLTYSSSEIELAIAYLETNHLTSGYTTIAGKDQSEDLALFNSTLRKKYIYINFLKEKTPEEIKKYEEFYELRNFSTPGRQSLPAVSVYVPSGISVYPYNTSYMIWMFISIIFAALGIIGIITFIDERSHVH